jgi:hypothetical protein
VSPDQIDIMAIRLAHPTGPPPQPDEIAQVLQASAELMRVCEKASLRAQYKWMLPALERVQRLKV